MIDLNTDLGGGGANDSALFQLASSVNTACGFHAGDAGLMVQSIREALKYGVAVGAHPGYPDRENFDRTVMDLLPEAVYAQMLYQIGVLAAIVQVQSDELQHVKPHGMLHNQAAKLPLLADAIARAIRNVNPKLVLVGLAGSEPTRVGQHYGLTTCQKVSVDRGYLADGSLVPRSQPGALVDSKEQALVQTLEMAQHHRVCSTSGEWVNVVVQTVCPHGDGPHVLDFACRLRAAFAGRHILASAQPDAEA